MKAAIHRKYGPPEVVNIEDVPKPIYGEKELLISVRATTVNRTDCGFRSAEYFVSRFFSGLFKPNNPTLGCEFAGVIEAIGDRVTNFKVGDRVFGYNDKRFGAHAEYMIVSVDDPIAMIPPGLSFEEAAPILEGSHYAWCDILAAKVHQGQNVLVYGATGSIGSAAVQILKSLGVRVTAVCPTKYVDLVRKLGADIVIDYMLTDYTQTEERYDFVFDAVGKSSFGMCKKVLTPHGIYISTELGKHGENVWKAIFSPWRKGKRILFPIPVINKEMVEHIRSLVVAGQFKPLVDRSYKLDEIREAYRYVETGQKIGNVVINIDQSTQITR